MLSIKKSRELIENSEEYSDAKIEEIRDALNALAELAFEKWLEEKKQTKKIKYGRQTKKTYQRPKR